ncbi:MAG: hypothetical protein KatS3mg087_1531 [Patescibacteria group bacterium]|nr:MAG: hypothetical protein KatS3mg087_1531 [Patescibacteria group bacterium]
MYVIFEGVDGAGKSHLASECAVRWRRMGRRVSVLSEPFFPRSMLSRVRAQSFLEQSMIFDRYRVRAYERRIMPLLSKGRSLFQVRSWVSTAVYQYYRGGYLDLLPSYISLSLGLMPEEPVFIILDVDYPTARMRKTDLEWDGSTYDKLRSGYYWIANYLFRKNLSVAVIRNNLDVDSAINRIMLFLESC